MVFVNASVGNAIEKIQRNLIKGESALINSTVIAFFDPIIPLKSNLSTPMFTSYSRRHNDWKNNVEGLPTNFSLQQILRVLNFSEICAVSLLKCS